MFKFGTLGRIFLVLFPGLGTLPMFCFFYSEITFVISIYQAKTQSQLFLMFWERCVMFPHGFGTNLSSICVKVCRVDE